MASPGVPARAPIEGATRPLSDELWCLIASYTDVWDRVQLVQVSRLFRARYQPGVTLAGAAIVSFDADPDDAVARLCSLGFFSPAPLDMTRFLYRAHHKLPAKAIGRFITAPKDEDVESQRSKAAVLMTAYLSHFDFTDDTPAQALRRLLIRTRLPPGTRCASCLLKRLAARYIECQRHAAGENAPPIAAFQDSDDEDAGHASHPRPANEAGSGNTHPMSSGAGGAHGGAAGGGGHTSSSLAFGALAELTTAPTPPHHPAPPAGGGGVGAGSGAPASRPSPTLAAPPEGPGVGEEVVAFVDGLHEDGDWAHVFGPGVLTNASKVTHACPVRRTPTWSKRVLYGVDLATLDFDTMFIILYSLLILNTDMRSTAIKTKMTRDDFVQRNMGIPSLAHLRPTFFKGMYDEIAMHGLPVADNVPVAPVKHATPLMPPPKAAAALRPLTASPMDALRVQAEVAASWLRRITAPPLPPSVMANPNGGGNGSRSGGSSPRSNAAAPGAASASNRTSPAQATGGRATSTWLPDNLGHRISFTSLRQGLAHAASSRRG